MNSMNDYIRVPFVDRGRSWQGADCWGLVVLFYRREFGIDLEDVSYYSNSNALDEVSCAVGKEKQNWYQVWSKSYGDVILMRVRGWPTHVGIYVGKQRVLHAQQQVGVTVERISHLQNIEGYYRHEHLIGKAASV